jgi:protein-disulfide isomerase
MIMNKLILTVGLCSSMLCAFAADNSSPAGGGTVLAEIDGTKLTLADVELRRPNGLFQARNAFYETTRKVVDEVVNEYVLEKQAKAENVTVAQLLERHVNGTIEKDPPEDALRVYYEGVETTEPYEAVRGQILDALRQRRLAKAKAAYLKSLLAESKITIRVGAPRAQVALKDTPVRGGKNAPVLVVEYADYECPYCQQAQPALDKLEAEYKGKMALAYKDTPLPMHPHAQKAAEAAHCAAAQGKYWEYHDLLFKSQKLEIPQLKEQARELKIDGAAFDKCLDSGEQSELVKVQLGEAQSLGLQGTPSFFINGRFFSGSLSYEALRGIVEEEIAASSSQQGEPVAR